jgi:SAM-dependent methyltransferase
MLRKFATTDFLLKQHCIPWKVRLLWRRILPWKIRRFLCHGTVNLNAPEAMDIRYLQQGDEFSSMENLYNHVLSLLPQIGRVLDAGCGIAVLMRHIRRRQPQLELHGVDFSPVAVERTKQYGFPAQVAVLPELPYGDEFFDAVVCTEVLEHLDEPDKSLREFCRVLVPGGRLVVSVPDGLGPDHCAEHVQAFTEQSLRDVLSRQGFTVRDLQSVFREPERNDGQSYLVLALKLNDPTSR